MPVSHAARRLSARQWLGLSGVALVLGAALAITLSPTPVDRGRRGQVAAVLDWAHGLGVPASFGYAELEFAANVLMFLPLGLFVGLLVRGRWWWLALAFPPLLSTGIELAQLLLLPERFADVSDVIANTLGGWLGVGIAALIPGRRGGRPGVQ